MMILSHEFPRVAVCFLLLIGILTESMSKNVMADFMIQCALYEKQMHPAKKWVG